MDENIVGELKVTPETYELFKKKITNLKTLEEEIKITLGEDTTSLIKVVMVGVLILNGSDIHIEPTEEGSDVRARIDGMLHTVAHIPYDKYKKLLSRIKLLSKLKLNIEKKPQDGRFSIEFVDSEIEIRTSTLPSEYGETVVMRILNPKNLINLEDLGLRPDLEKLFNEEIEKPNGMIIVTGPTGSGKTTSLYAFLKKMRKPEIKIITIEDPIEYHLEGITQTQVDAKKGYDFASGLRSIVRQDPDTILVGEIRDLETASTAIQAALTGHLVLSTLHTNDAAGAIARLQALGEKAVNIAPSINIIIAQRLVRKLCPKCKRIEKISQEELEIIKKETSKLPEEIELPLIDENLEIAHPVGCEYCNGTGYKGRVGIFEAIVVGDDMENFILSSPSSVDLEKKAIELGMTTMKQDGIIKILKKETSFEEVKRVAG